MNTNQVLIFSAVLAVGAGAITSYALRQDAPIVPEPYGGASEELADLRTQLDLMASELKELRQREAQGQLPSVIAQGRLQVEDVDEAVRRYFAELDPGATATGVDAIEATASKSEKDAQEWLEMLEAPNLDEQGRQEIWNRIRESGKLDEAIALLEARAEEFSNDPDAQVDVASAYVQKIFEVGEGPEAGLWATKADRSLDRALELDDHHWNARFSKAIGLSFWPPIFGKQREAISHFNTLIQQQESGPVESRHSQSYLLLGNLYAQSGDIKEAEAVWKKGLGLFPDDLDLQSKLGE
jgi:tetratricopeptide (TPR) repeat protein